MHTDYIHLMTWIMIGRGRGWYSAHVQATVQGETKASIQQSMAEVTGCGAFFTQHATLLLTNGGCADRASRMGIKDVHDSCTLGGGAHRVLNITVAEQLGFHLGKPLAEKDLDKLAILERERWRSAGLAAGLSETIRQVVSTCGDAAKPVDLEILSNRMEAS